MSEQIIILIATVHSLFWVLVLIEYLIDIEKYRYTEEIFNNMHKIDWADFKCLPIRNKLIFRKDGTPYVPIHWETYLGKLYRWPDGSVSLHGNTGICISTFRLILGWIPHYRLSKLTRIMFKLTR